MYMAHQATSLRKALHPYATIRNEDYVAPRVIVAMGYTPPCVMKPMHGCYKTYPMCLAHVST